LECCSFYEILLSTLHPLLAEKGDNFMIQVKDIYGNLPTLETERLRLRKVTKKDVRDMFEYASNEKVSRYVNWEKHRKLQDTKEFVSFVLKQYSNQSISPWAMEIKALKKCIGTIDFVTWNPTHRIAEIGYAISEEYWNKGFVTEAAEKVIAFGFEEMDLVRIQARCFVENAASEKVMKKIGMSYEGTIRKAMFIKGAHQDLKLYSILREEYTRNA
jgi:[ribosomal protein S5]-alanine N-acetyltransferase